MMGYDGRAEPSCKRPRPRWAGAAATTNSPGPRSLRDALPPGRRISQLMLSTILSSARSLLPGDVEVAALGPHPVQDDRKPAGGGDDRPLHAPPLGELEAPGL